MILWISNFAVLFVFGLPWYPLPSIFIFILLSGLTRGGDTGYDIQMACRSPDHAVDAVKFLFL